MESSSTAPEADGLIKRLADVAHISEDRVRQVYEDQYRMLERGAKVRSYLPALAMRHTRERLLHH